MAGIYMEHKVYVLDEEIIDDTRKMVAIAEAGYSPNGIDVFFRLEYRVPTSPTPDKWVPMPLLMGALNRPMYRRFLPVAAKLYRRVKKIDGVRPDLTFHYCAM